MWDLTAIRKRGFNLSIRTLLYFKMCLEHTAGRSEWSTDLETFAHPAVLNELFTKQLLKAEECSEIAKTSCRWESHLIQVLSTKLAEVVQEACRVLEKHGCPVKELKSKLFTHWHVVFWLLCYSRTNWTYFFHVNLRAVGINLKIR